MGGGGNIQISSNGGFINSMIIGGRYTLVKESVMDTINTINAI